MAILLLRTVRQLPGHHHTRADGGPGSQTDDTGGQGVRAFALVLEVNRGITVEGCRLMDLDLVGDGGLEEQVRLGTADAGMTDTHRPGHAVIETDNRAVGIGCRPFAAQLVEAVAFGVGRVAIGLGKAAGIEMGPALAVFVDLAAVGELGTTQLIQFRQFVEGYIIQYGRQEVVGVGWTAGDVDDRLVLDDLTHTDRTGRIGPDGLDAAIAGAGADGDY